MKKLRSKKSSSTAKTVEALLQKASPELIDSVKRILEQNEQAFSILCIEESLREPSVAVYSNGLDEFMPRVA